MAVVYMVTEVNLFNIPKKYRFSISWTRLIPGGKWYGDGEVSNEGVDFYNNLINSLLDAGITPLVTLYHWNLPLALQVK